MSFAMATLRWAVASLMMDQLQGYAMTTDANTLEALRERIVRFADERDWDQFHNPKNVVMALAVEAAELLEHFQWRTPEESASLNPEEKEAVALEAADVLLYLLRLCDKLGIDLAAAAQRKIAINEQKYPAHKSRGRSTKYDKL